jgi:4'-phosphopantetheinyl transferase EntD
MLDEFTINRLRKVVALLMPTGVGFEVASVEDCRAELSAEELSLIERWVSHRQREFATGRLCARRALSALGSVSGNLLPNAAGIPVWPEGVIGSISHSRGVAMAVVARSAGCPLLGLDLEKTNRLSVAAIKRVVHPLEESFVAGDQRKASIIFSLKEAFYKAQFPKWRTDGNFRDLALSVDFEEGSATVRQMDGRFAPELRQLQFAFRLVDEYVVSLCWL